jgi:hypothetical protein
MDCCPTRDLWICVCCVTYSAGFQMTLNWRAAYHALTCPPPVKSWYTDVIMKDPRFNSRTPVRDINLLWPPFRAKIAALIADATAEGHDIRTSETYRSQALQTYYFEVTHTTRLRTVGVHHYGLAVDLVLYVGGVYESRGDRYYNILEPLCEKYKLISGADWGFPPPSAHDFNDWGHVQAIPVLQQGPLFAGHWYPSNDYVPPNFG